MSKGGPVSFHDIGQSVPKEIGLDIKRKLNSILNWKKNDIAPFTLPTSLTRKTLHIVGEQPHFVCEESPGCRLLCLLVSNGCYLISHNYNFRYAPLFCPIRPEKITDKRTVHVRTINVI